MKSIKGIALIAVSILLTIYAWASAGMTNFIVPVWPLTTLSLTFYLRLGTPFWKNGSMASKRCMLIISLPLSFPSFFLLSTMLPWAAVSGALIWQPSLEMSASISLSALFWWPISASTSNMRLGAGFIALSIWPISLVSSTPIC